MIIAGGQNQNGRETRQKRADTSSKLGELYEFEVMARAAGVMTGPKGVVGDQDRNLEEP